TGTMPFMPMTLRLEAADGSGADEYRICDGEVEIRTRQGSDDQAGTEDNWQRLTPEQLSRHVQDNTIVAQWLKRRLGWRRLLRACVGQQTLHEFGISDKAVDRRAA